MPPATFTKKKNECRSHSPYLCKPAMTVLFQSMTEGEIKGRPWDPPTVTTD